jgi:zinc transporter
VSHVDIPDIMVRVLDGKGQAAPLELDALPAPADITDPTWIHINRKSEPGRRWLEQSSGLDAAVIEALHGGHSRPRVEVLGDGVLLLLRGVNLNPGAEPEEMISVRIWLEKHRIISLWREPLQTVRAVCETIEQGKGPKSIGELLTRLLAGLTDRISAVTDEIDDMLDAIEDRVAAGDGQTERAAINEIRQRIIGLHRYLVPQVQALNELLDADTKLLLSRQRRQVRDVTHRAQRIREDLDAGRSRAAVILDEITNQQAEQLNHRMYAITVIAAIFLPLTLITGLLGMNVGGIPGGDTPLGFTITCAILLVLGVVGYWVVRRFRLL